MQAQFFKINVQIVVILFMVSLEWLLTFCYCPITTMKQLNICEFPIFPWCTYLCLQYTHNTTWHLLHYHYILQYLVNSSLNSPLFKWSGVFITCKFNQQISTKMYTVTLTVHCFDELYCVCRILLFICLAK